MYYIEFPINRRYCGYELYKDILNSPGFGQDKIFFMLWKTYKKTVILILRKKHLRYKTVFFFCDKLALEV